jgi:hypothetical protein
MSGPIAQRVDKLYYGAKEVPVKRALANVNASQTDSTLVAAVADKRIRVVALVMQAGGTATDSTFDSYTGSVATALSPLFHNLAGACNVLPFLPTGWFETKEGEALTVTTSAGSATGYLIEYVEV